ncbi:MAG: hypothetical protein WBD81_12330 [Collimonas pratensis]|uniref:hypothetical protein n=1 Tax=Collimonas pratensis TaxID=279113 RepID=UPI003C77ACEF
MDAANPQTNEDMAVQEHCIDLPGESVQCWVGGGTDKLKVILRKHRDVIFDIKLGNGKIYTIETTDSDFYNARDKKIVYAARHGKVTFNDGERMHVWVSRGFRGALVLKCGDHILSRVEPNEWDKHRQSDDPKAKPAPIIVTMGSPPSAAKPTPMHLSTDEHTAHVHEVSKEGAPPLVLKFFEDGGESLHLDSENIITRNWITSQLAGTAGYVLDNHTWIKELMGSKFSLQRVIHKAGPKVYMIFSGNQKLREIMSGSRYGLTHTKIMRITGGAGGAKQGWNAMKGAVKDSGTVFAKEEGKMVVKGVGLAVVFTVVLDVAEWYKDYSEIGADGKPKKDFSDLFAKIGTDLVKAGIVAALTTATIAIGFGLLAAAGVTIAAPVIAVVVGTIAVAVAWSFLLEKIDKAVGRALGKQDTTSWLAEKFRAVAEYLSTATKDIRYSTYPDVILF